MKRVAVVGATGYVGSELVRWLLGHPELSLVQVVSRSQAGRPLAEAVPALAGVTDLQLMGLDSLASQPFDVVFLALPHGAAAPIVALLQHVPLVVDCSADHRLTGGSWVHAVPELAAERFVGASRIAVPGCFATAMMLGIGPLARTGAINGVVTVVAATGSTGSGAQASSTTHHPERFANLRAYAVGTHRHVPEVHSFLGSLGGGQPVVHFVPLSAPIDRGIFATCTIPIATASEGDANAVFHDAYDGSPMMRFREGSPELRHVRGTGFADWSVVPSSDGVVTTLIALDNLGKGASAQAIQCANLALGLPDQTGLRLPACTP